MSLDFPPQQTPEQIRADQLAQAAAIGAYLAKPAPPHDAPKRAAKIVAPRCAACLHYSRPGQSSSRCLMGPPPFARPCPDHPSYAIVRADNVCERFVSRELSFVIAEAA